MMDFVLVSSDLRPHVLDTRSCQLISTCWAVGSGGRRLEKPGKPNRGVRMDWERLVEDPVPEAFNSHLRMNLSHIQREAGLRVQTSPVDPAARSCGQEVITVSIVVDAEAFKLKEETFPAWLNLNYIYHFITVQK